MLVKINSRGKGGGAGAVNYLIGDFGTVDGRMPKQEERAQGIGKRKVKPVVLRGDAQQTKELIDSLSFSRNYTSGTLSFAEQNIPDHQKQALMDEYTKMLLAGLDADQYDVLWVEHRDKDRLELNFLIPNVELGTGKRLQPYYDKVDRDRVNAWQQIVNDRYGFTDPHDPQNKRFVVKAHDLPTDKKLVVDLITKSLTNLVSLGAIKNRADVINEIEINGFEIARETKSAISIKDPKGGKNIRLRGALYERDFKFSEETRAIIESTNREYQEQRKQRLSAARDTLNQAYKAKCNYNKKRYPRAKQAEPASNRNSNIQSIASVPNGNGLGRSISRGRTVHTTEIKHPIIKKVRENHVRCQSGISESIKAVIRAVRTAVQRSKSADKRVSRSNNFAHQLRAKQQPSFIARRKNSRAVERSNQRPQRGFSVPSM